MASRGSGVEMAVLLYTTLVCGGACPLSAVIANLTEDEEDVGFD